MIAYIGGILALCNHGLDNMMKSTVVFEGNNVTTRSDAARFTRRFLRLNNMHVLVTTILTDHASITGGTPWGPEKYSESYEWLQSDLLKDIPKYVYNSDEYQNMDFHELINKHRLPYAAEDESRDNGGSHSLFPWASIFSGITSIQNSTHVEPIANPRRAQECPGVFTYIIDHYHDLPAVMFFVHGRPMNHNHNILAHIHNLSQWDPLKLGGFVHLNNEFHVKRAVKELHGGECMKVYDLLGIKRKLLGHHVAIPCCAQFAVTRDRVLAHSVSWYKLARKLSIDTADCSCMEHIWHFIFGESPLMSPDHESSVMLGEK